jgi:hypothetical protein
MFQFPEWQLALEEALREADPGTFPSRFKAAKDAIFSRLKAKFERPPGPVERIALNDAIQMLRALRSEAAPHYSRDPRSYNID